MIYRYDQITDRTSFEKSEKIITNNLDGYPVHWGQLKLLITEIMFLTKDYDPDEKYIVLYIGASPGEHINFLVKLFPNFHYVLYDGVKSMVKPQNNIEIKQQLFLEKDVEEYKSRAANILFISDIRNLRIKYKEDQNEMDNIIETDLLLQKKILDGLRPKAAYLKFRLAYRPGTFDYYTGKIYMQPFGPVSTETRLLVTDYDSIMTYNNAEFDEKMAYFNSHDRLMKYNDFCGVLDALKLRNYWDTTAMCYILKLYLERVKYKSNRRDNASDYPSDKTSDKTSDDNSDHDSDHDGSGKSKVTDAEIIDLATRALDEASLYKRKERYQLEKIATVPQC